MDWLPIQSETYVSSLTAEEMIHKWQKVVKPSSLSSFEQRLIPSRKQQEPLPFFFEGRITNNTFKLIPYSGYVEQFAPLVEGKIESASQGCILFLRYRLMSGTMFLMVLGFIIFCILLMVFLLVQQNYANLFWTLIFIFTSYLVFLLNFQQKIRATRSLIKKVILDENNL